MTGRHERDIDDQAANSAGRYSAIITDGDTVLIYDRQNTDAWIQSESATKIGSMA